jgi:hypothetical protein
MTMKKFLLIFVLTSSIANAQWKPDRADYNQLSAGNFWTTAPDMQTALAIALNTLEYNGAKMHTLNIDKKDTNSPLFNYFHRDAEPGFVYVSYVARTKTGYLIWFRHLLDEPIEFEEEYTILEYEGDK